MRSADYGAHRTAWRGSSSTPTRGGSRHPSTSSRPALLCSPGWAEYPWRVRAHPAHGTFGDWNHGPKPHRKQSLEPWHDVFGTYRRLMDRVRVRDPGRSVRKARRGASLDRVGCLVSQVASCSRRAAQRMSMRPRGSQGCFEVPPLRSRCVVGRNQSQRRTGRTRLVVARRQVEWALGLW